MIYLNHQLILVALNEYGESEIRGRRHNSRILEYLSSVGLGKRDETPWCSAFVNYVASQCGATRSHSALAMGWAEIGYDAGAIEDAIPGDIVVLSRGRRSWQGHVGFFVREQAGKIFVLGGNQADRVSIQAYPKSRLRALRRLERTRPLTCSK